MKILNGTHGTSRTRACCIRSDGFKISKGRLGVGIYFWRGGFYARDLAISWWKFKNNDTNFYKCDKDRSCSVIYVTICIEAHEYLNTDDYDFKETLLKLAKVKNIKMNDERKLASFYDYFIEALEKRCGVKYRVLEVRVATPPGSFQKLFPIKYISVPHCYVARENSCVKITRIEEINHV